MASASTAGQPDLASQGKIRVDEIVSSLEWLCPLEACSVPRSTSYHLLAVMTAALLAGCATVRPTTVRMQAPDQPTNGVVFVADGSGDLRQVSDNLAACALESPRPLAVKRVEWSHGKGSVFSDLYDAAHHKQQGKILAQQILAYRQTHPAQRVCLIGYSSGASVVLAAAEHLPPCTVDRMVLLAPSVASRHDLRPALRASREGIDAFLSEWDVISIALFAVGTGDGFGTPVAGRSGFSPVVQSPADELLYQGLRQHWWAGPAQWQGHDGGHYGCYHPDFLRQQVLPLLVR
jgi:pimeloyl-ACP methyl ester carboxylesterase